MCVFKAKVKLLWAEYCWNLLLSIQPDLVFLTEEFISFKFKVVINR